MEGQREARPLSEASLGPAWADVRPEPLSDRDRMTVRGARREFEAQPLPAGRGPVGCLAGIGGALLLGGWPVLRTLVPGGDFVSPFVVLAGLVLVLGGLYATLLVGRRGRAAGAAVEAALRQLEGPGEGEDASRRLSSDRDVDLRAAVLLLSSAFVGDGSTVTRTFEPEEAASRLGPRLGLVLAVQDVLAEDLGGLVPFERERAGAEDRGPAGGGVDGREPADSDRGGFPA